jgi:broad specificity phosphatase PhoE
MLFEGSGLSSLLLLRHGQASFGAAEYDRLSDLGTQQARLAGVHLRERGLRIDHLLTGPRQRHHTSAAALTEGLGQALDATTEPALDEFADGRQVLQLVAGASGEAGRLALYAQVIEGWSRGEVAIPGAPGADAFCAGVAGWLDRVAQRSERGQQWLAVTSAGVIAAAVCAVLQQPPSALAHWIMMLRNASLTEIVFSGPRRSLLSFNGVAHLPPEAVTRM